MSTNPVSISITGMTLTADLQPDFLESATEQANLAKRYAVGGVIDGDTTDNAKYYKDQAESVLQQIEEIIEGIPQGGGNGTVVSVNGVSPDANGNVVISVSGGGIVVNAADYGAVGNGVADDGVAIRNAIAAIKAAGGGTLYLPGKHKVSPVDINQGCLYIDFDNFELCGSPKSELIVTNGAHVPIHVSSEPNLSIIPQTSTGPKNIKIHDITIRGTGVYEYYALAKGRGILLRHCYDVEIYNCHVIGISMIGICSEHAFGKFNVHDNVLEDCKFTSINYNGRCYQSMICDNIMSGAGGTTNAMHIQVTGGCIVRGNQIYGDPAHPELIGGIIYGEGNYTGSSEISGNIIKHCGYGIKAFYHGYCSISNNVLVNCITHGGIVMVRGTEVGLTIPSDDNIIANNHCINCSPYGISIPTDNNLITGNKVINIPSPLNPCPVGHPDYIASVTTEVGIKINGSNNSLVGNSVSGCVIGWSYQIDREMGNVVGNKFSGTTCIHRVESSVSGVYALPVATTPERTTNGARYKEMIFSDNRPTSGYSPLGSEWKPTYSNYDTLAGSTVTNASKTTVSVTTASGATSVTLTNASGWIPSATNTVAGFQLNDGSWHWCAVTGVNGNVIGLSVPVPSGKSIPSGASAYFNYWKEQESGSVPGVATGSYTVASGKGVNSASVKQTGHSISASFNIFNTQPMTAGVEYTMGTISGVTLPATKAFSQGGAFQAQNVSSYVTLDSNGALVICPSANIAANVSYLLSIGYIA